MTSGVVTKRPFAKACRFSKTISMEVLHLDVDSGLERCHDRVVRWTCSQRCLKSVPEGVIIPDGRNLNQGWVCNARGC